MNGKEIVKERIKYRHPMFHFTEYNSKRVNRLFPDIPWHWHEDFEVSCVRSGKVIYRTVSKEILLKPGDAVFINSKVIHSVTPLEPRTEIYHISQFFDNNLIAGSEGNVIDAKYVMPIQKNEEIDIIVLPASEKKFDKFRKLLDSNSELFEEENIYFEFDIRQNICEMWRIIRDSVEDIDSDIPILPIANKRLRKAITYIQKHYKEKITLDDIADNVHISIRECNRMFNKYLKISPINYLQSVRMQKATSMLSDTNISIVDVALENGYTSSSYFGKKFKEQHHITPKEYRDRLIAEKKK